jgi:hypothetical protein
MKEYKLKIKVTKDILKKSMMCGTNIPGLNYPPENCAIAIAVREIFPKARVGCVLIYINDSFTNISLPLEASLFINKFDELVENPIERLNLPELEFEITLPESYINSINIDEVKEVLKNSETLELITK